MLFLLLGIIKGINKGIKRGELEFFILRAFEKRRERGKVKASEVRRIIAR